MQVVTYPKPGPRVQHENPSAKALTVRLWGLAAAGVAIILDQATKSWALASAVAHEPNQLTSFLNLVLVHNRGVTFGALAGSGTPWWVLSLVALVIITVLCVWLSRESSRIGGFALGLIIGGALGNVIDRWRHGAVTDFIDLHAGGWHWPAFNLADVAICCGVVVLMLHSIAGQSTKRGRDGSTDRC